MNVRIVLMFLIFIVLHSCKNNSNFCSGNDKILTQCDDNLLGYQIFGNYCISNYYVMNDWQINDLDFDNKKDSIVIFVPDHPDSICCLKTDSVIFNRYLMMKIGDTTYCYNNVLSDDVWMTYRGCEFIERTKKGGFLLQYHLGQSCFFDYEIYINHRNKIFYMDSINIRTGCPGVTTLDTTFNYYNMDLIDFDRTIIDTLLENYAI